MTATYRQELANITEQLKPMARLVRRSRVLELIVQYGDGLISEAELHHTLDLMRIQGNFTGKPEHWVSYDYAEQEWLVLGSNS